MKTSSTAKWLSNAVRQAARSAKFCVAGCLPAVDPGLEVAGLGAVRLPLKRTVAKELIARCRVAPYGKGTRTLVDRGVRNSFELDPKKFQLGDGWNSQIAKVTRQVAEELGLPAGQVEARLYKLLVYERGGFFLPHRDSEKDDRMVASLVVVLPNPFEGGTLIVRHGTANQTLTFDEAAAGRVPCYAAFYADCKHEVQKVARGVRLCLAYNLVLKSEPARPAAEKPGVPADELAASITSWVKTRPAEPLVFALEHHYTQRGLVLDLLKGADRQLAASVVAAAEQAGCLVHLVQVSRHLCQSTYDDADNWHHSWDDDDPDPGDVEVGETIEDELSATEWTDLRGKKQPWGEIPFEVSAVVSSIPLDDWKPTRQEYEGYTGNAGNTLDRWYHRSALVVWHRDQHFDVIAGAGAHASVPLFRSMAARLARTPQKRREEARTECIRFARAIIADWPESYYWYDDDSPRESSPLDKFADGLLLLHDRDTVARFLAKVAEADAARRLGSFVVSGCRKFGWNAFARELKQLLTTRADPYDPGELPFRDAEWLAAFCLDEADDPDKSALAGELCSLAVKRFCQPRRARDLDYWEDDRRGRTASEKALPLLLQALAAGGTEEAMARVIHFVEESPDEFSMDHGRVPALKTLIPWARKELGRIPAPLTAWLAVVRRQLEAATAHKPEPPTDWVRPAEVACRCPHCRQLNTFLANPENKVGRIAAREDVRRHLVDQIRRHRCDVKTSLERKGSPYSLVLTKTSGSYERALKRYQMDRKLLAALPVR